MRCCAASSRSGAELFAAADADLAQRHAHPRWLVDALRRGLG